MTGAFFGSRKSTLAGGGLVEPRPWFTVLPKTTYIHLSAVDAVQGIKKGQAFGVALSTTKAKARFTAEHVGAASLTFGV